jgi:YidC/Oxa1 family membrane protein insertase
LYDKPGKKVSKFTFTGPAYYAGNKLHEVKLDDIGEKHAYTGPVDWIGYGDDYFLTALIPIVKEGPWNILIEKKEADGLTESRLTALKPSPKGAGQGVEVLRLGVYYGPKEIDRLNALGHNLSKAINFGWFDPIAKPLLYIFKFFYRFIHNYGIAIIIVTLLIKIAFWPLAQKSAKSMKTMQKLQPKLAKLKEKYGNDKEKMNKELMQLYKTYKVNPMSGCLPMLLQIPVFFALYKVLLQSIELRHAPFMLWINDLSAPDRLMIPGVNIPYLGGIPVLTLLMGLSMYLQQKLSPSSLDPTQARMMQFLPVIFTFMFINFPSGLVLYWLVNNVLSIAQQHYVNKFTS